MFAAVKTYYMLCKQFKGVSLLCIIQIYNFMVVIVVNDFKYPGNATQRHLNEFPYHIY